MNPDARWLEAEFSSYDLYYVDPLISKDAQPDSPPVKSRPRISRSSREGEKLAVDKWYWSDTEATLAVLEKVRQLLGVNAMNSEICQFFDEHIIDKLSEDRGKQTQIVDALISGLFPPTSLESKTGEKTTKPQDRGRMGQIMNALIKILRRSALPENKTVLDDRIVDERSNFNRKVERFQDLPNRNTVECLVAFDGMITSVDPELNSDLYQSVVVTSRHEDHHARSIRFCLAKQPGPLLSLDDWRIGLMVDQKGLAKTYPTDSGTAIPQNVVALDGWYPFARVIGFWQTERGGRPFIDVLAILIKAFPSMDRILRKRVTATQRCFIEMLKYGRDTAEERKAALLGGSPYNPEDDYRLLYPYLLATLCCHLNNTDWKNFKARGRSLFDLSNQYWDALAKLSKEIQAKNADSWLPDFVDPPEKPSRPFVPGLNASFTEGG